MLTYHGVGGSSETHESDSLFLFLHLFFGVEGGGEEFELGLGHFVLVAFLL